MTTSLSAETLLKTRDTGIVTKSFLHVVAQLDKLGARDWNLRTVAAVSFASLLVARTVGGIRGGIDWCALIHAIVTAIGSVMCTYLDLFSSHSLTGTNEPLRSCLCHPALTSLHRILPAITLGYDPTLGYCPMQK
jgi:hypothetical protein